MEEILNRIKSDCDESVRAIELEAENKRSEAMSEAKKQAELVCEEISEKSKAKLAQIKASSKSRAELEVRNALLKRRRQEIDITTKKLMEHIIALDDNAYFEKKFGNQTKSEETWIPVTETERMAIQGVIDRIDYLATEDKVLFRVIDYKTGYSEVNLDRVYYGLQLQLFLYLSAAKEILAVKESLHGKRMIPAGVYYYNMDDPVLENDFSAEDSEIEKQMFKELRMKGITNFEDHIPEYTDHTLTKAEKSESDVIGFDYTAKGEVGRYSKTLGTKAMQMVSDHVKDKMLAFGKQMYSGDVAATPAVWKKQSGCQYCGYASICGQVNSGRKEREFEEIKDYAEIIKRIGEREMDADGKEESDE